MPIKGLFRANKGADGIYIQGGARATERRRIAGAEPQVPVACQHRAGVGNPVTAGTLERT
jgi:hypothetical protein